MRKTVAFLILTYAIGCGPLSAFSEEGVILGGIGTGKIEILPDGRLAGFTMNHNPDKPIDDPAGCFAAIAVESGSETIVKRLSKEENNPSAIQSVNVSGNYPYANVDYVDAGLPVKIRLRAFSPMVPGNVDESCYPAVVFEYTVENTSQKNIPVTLAMSWRNLIGLGGIARETLDISGTLTHRMIRPDRCTGISFQMETPVKTGLELNALGEHALVYRASGNEKPTVLSLWNPESDPVAFQTFMIKPGDSGKIRDEKIAHSSIGAARPAAAVAARQMIPAGASRTFTFILAWRMPHWMAKDGTDYGVYYANRWNSIQEAIDDLGKQSPRLEEKIKEWEKRLFLQSSFPGWLQERMRNGMAVLARDGVLLADGRFAMLTGNPEFPGNLGSPEERLADVNFLLSCFPDLLRSELETFTNCQLSNGEVPSAIGNVYNILGNGNIAGGFTGNPDSSAAYVLLVYQYYLWTGDSDFLKKHYPHIRSALQWLMSRDGNGDMIPDGSSLWPWACEGTTALFTGNVAMAAFRIGEELEQTFNDLEFQSWCRQQGEQIARNLSSQLWNGDYFNPFFDARRPAAPESQTMVPGQLPGEWFALMQGWNSFLPKERLHRTTQWIAQNLYTKAKPVSPNSEFSWRYGFAPAFTGPLLLRYGYGDAAEKLREGGASIAEPGWWSYARALSGVGVDWKRRCLFVGPVAAGSDASVSNEPMVFPFSTPMFSGIVHYSRSSLSGQQECELEIQNAPKGKDNGLMQIAFAFPEFTNVNEMSMQVIHNGKTAAGQDFSRESLRVFGFQHALKVKEGDAFNLFLSAKEGPRLVADIQGREIRNYGGKCRIDKIGMPLPGVSFYVTNQLHERHLLSLEIINPAQKQDYAVFINGEKKPFTIPSPEPISLALPLSGISPDEIAALHLSVKACQDAAVRLAAISGQENLKKKLWSLQEEMNRLVELDANQRGMRIDILPTSVIEQYKYTKPEESGRPIREDLARLAELTRSFLEAMQKESGDPVLASEIAGSFVPVEASMSAAEVHAASESFPLDLRIHNPGRSPIKGRLTLNLPEGWRATTNDDVEFDDREAASEERRFLFSIDAPIDLWQNRFGLDSIFSGTWNGFAFRKIQTTYVGHKFVKRWLIVGPFSNERGEGFGKMNPPEINIQTKETYDGIGQKVGWKEYEFPNGYVDFDSILKPNDNAVAYAYTSVYSPREQGVQFLVGCNGDLKLFLNYKEIHAKRNVGHPNPGGELVVHRLYEGWNHLVVKISERAAAWGFYFEVYDLQGKPIEGMQYALDKADAQ